MNGEPNRVAGVCSGLPLGIQDLMWGTDNARVRNKSDQRILKSTARILCDMCPIQAECLAQSIIGREQHSRIGGIDVKARRLLRHHAEADGLDLSPSNPARRESSRHGSATILNWSARSASSRRPARGGGAGARTSTPTGNARPCGRNRPDPCQRIKETQRNQKRRKPKWRTTKRTCPASSPWRT